MPKNRMLDTSTTLTIRVSLKDKKMLGELADADDRVASDYLRRLIRQKHAELRGPAKKRRPSTKKAAAAPPRRRAARKA